MLKRVFAARLGLLITLLQLLLSVGAPILDARAQEESRGAAAHVESHGTPACARIHSDDCVTCRVVSSLAASTAAAPALAPIARTIARGATRAGMVRSECRRDGNSSPRAPPTIG